MQELTVRQKALLCSTIFQILDLSVKEGNFYVLGKKDPVLVFDEKSKQDFQEILKKIFQNPISSAKQL